MKSSITTKLSFALLLLGSASLFSCSSGGGGGDDDDFEFKKSDLVNKYWYSDTYISSGYNQNDDVLVYRFESGGVLKRQQFSGKRDSAVGKWSLDNKNVLTIEDGSISNNHKQVLTIKSNSNSKELVLKGEFGVREFFTTVDKIDDVSADAYLVKEVSMNGLDEQVASRLECEVMGNNLDEVTIMYNENDDHKLIETKNADDKNIFVVSADDKEKNNGKYLGKRTVKFYAKVKGSGSDFEKIKLSDQIYKDDITAITYKKDFSRANGGLTVNWTAIDEDKIFYYVEILDEADENAVPYFRSNRQPADSGEAMKLEITPSTGAEVNRVDQLVSEKNYLVRVTAIKYEYKIDPINSSNKEINIQAKTSFAYKINW